MDLWGDCTIDKTIWRSKKKHLGTALCKLLYWQRLLLHVFIGYRILGCTDCDISRD